MYWCCSVVACFWNGNNGGQVDVSRSLAVFNYTYINYWKVLNVERVFYVSYIAYCSRLRVRRAGRSPTLHYHPFFRLHPCLLNNRDGITLAGWNWRLCYRYFTLFTKRILNDNCINLPCTFMCLLCTLFPLPNSKY